MARILLAEPDQRIRNLMAGILGDCGHAVEICRNAVEASASLNSGAIDLVVTDIVLNGDGETTLGRDCSALGIPALTLSGQEFHPGQSHAERPAALLEKPFRFADLQSVLDAIASHSSAVSTTGPHTYFSQMPRRAA